MKAPLLELEALHVRYGAVEILKGVNLTVGSGECVALIGANGAGKSTTLMAISGIVPSDSGTIRFQGKSVQRWTADQMVKEGLVQVPEGRRVFPRLTVQENLLLGACCRTDRAEIQRDLDQMVELFPILGKRQHQLAGTLSGGEQQMLAFGRGLMARPKLLLLDEPSLGLAPKMVTQVFEVIRRIHREGLAILLVEQNAYQALQVAERAFVLQTGKVVLSGSAKELSQNPQVKEAYLGG